MALIAAGLSGCYETSNGEKIGIITKIAKQGVFCQTWEAEIIRGGLNGGTGVNGSAFHFTVADDATAKKITEAMEAGQEVKISYRAEMATFCRSDSENHFLKSFEVLEQKKSSTPGVANTSGGDLGLIKRLLEVQAELLQELAK